MVFKPRKFRQGKDKKCWCGSKKKLKNCHGQPGPEQTSVPRTTTTKAQEAEISRWGVSGEEHKLWVAPIFRGEDPSTKVHNLQGSPGRYKVQLLMSRPGFALWPETEFKFIDSLLGESYIAIAKPLRERGEKDAVEVRLEATTPHGKVTFRGLPNDHGFLGKFEVELMASSFADAEAVGYGSLAPFLSSWALHLDIPVNIHTIQVTELITSIHSVRARMPHTEMTFSGGVTPHLTDEFCHYASVYREGMNSNSSFYRFLCFFKIIESIVARRARMNADRAAAGLQISRVQEFMPSTNAEAQKVLEQIYPWKKTWNDVNFDELFPAEVRGKKIGNVADKFNKIRVGIAHAVLKTGEIRISIDRLDHIQQVNLWLPLCRVLARWMLKNEFSIEFALEMKELTPDLIAKYAAP